MFRPQEFRDSFGGKRQNPMGPMRFDVVENGGPDKWGGRQTTVWFQPSSVWFQTLRGRFGQTWVVRVKCVPASVCNSSAREAVSAAGWCNRNACEALQPTRVPQPAFFVGRRTRQARQGHHKFYDAAKRSRRNATPLAAQKRAGCPC